MLPKRAMWDKIFFTTLNEGQANRSGSLNRFDPKYASFGPRAPRPRPPAPPPALATFSPDAPRHHPPAHPTHTPAHPTHPPADKYATVRPQRRTDPQPLSAAALEYRSLQRPRRQPNNQHRRRHEARDPRDTRDPREQRDPRDQRDARDQRDPRDTRDTRDLYAVTEL
ncbi:unnamed protein product, partial [Brenthis ino]